MNADGCDALASDFRECDTFPNVFDLPLRCRPSIFAGRRGLLCRPAGPWPGPAPVRLPALVRPYGVPDLGGEGACGLIQVVRMGNGQLATRLLRPAGAVARGQPQSPAPAAAGSGHTRLPGGAGRAQSAPPASCASTRWATANAELAAGTPQ